MMQNFHVIVLLVTHAPEKSKFESWLHQRKTTYLHSIQNHFNVPVYNLIWTADVYVKTYDKIPAIWVRFNGQTFF